jgi:hypothetical protein
MATYLISPVTKKFKAYKEKHSQDKCESSPKNIGNKYYDVPTLKKDSSSLSESLQGAIIEVMTHNTSHTRIKHMKCSES